MEISFLLIYLLTKIDKKSRG